METYSGKCNIVQICFVIFSIFLPFLFLFSQVASSSSTAFLPKSWEPEKGKTSPRPWICQMQTFIYPPPTAISWWLLQGHNIFLRDTRNYSRSCAISHPSSLRLSMRKRLWIRVDRKSLLGGSQRGEGDFFSSVQNFPTKKGNVCMLSLLRTEAKTEFKIWQIYIWLLFVIGWGKKYSSFRKVEINFPVSRWYTCSVSKVLVCTLYLLSPTILPDKKVEQIH